MANIIVNSLLDNGDGDRTTLREAIAEANANAGADTITFDLDAGALIRLNGTEIEITGELVIDGGGEVIITADSETNDILVAGSDITDVAATEDDTGDLYSDNSRIFHITNENATTTLKGLILTGGRIERITTFDKGGALRSVAELVLENMTMSGNSTTGAVSGGGALIVSQALTVTNSTFNGNSATGSGGAIYGYSTIAVTGSTFSGNTSGTYGGGIKSGEHLTLIDSIVTENSARSGGGISGNESISLINSTISDNTAQALGGGIINSQSGSPDRALTVTGSTISGNSAEAGGGINGFNDVILNNSTISGNSASTYGGGIFGNGFTVIVNGEFQNHGIVTLNNSTISGNTAATHGGIHVAQSQVYLNNSIVLGDAANGSEEVYGKLGITSNNSIYLDADPANIFAETEEIAPGVLAGVLADNGGPTKTIRILAGGLAHNKGGETGLTTDQRGEKRVVGSATDIGAVELANHAPVAVNEKVKTDGDTAITGLLLTNDSDIDDDDLTISAVNGQVAAVGGRVTLASGALLLVNEDGEFSYDPNGAFDDLLRGMTETDSFEYTITDGELVASAMASITIEGQAQKTTSTTTPGPDKISGTRDTDTISGLKGNDTIRGGGGDDALKGGKGADHISGGSGNDAVAGGKGKDVLAGGKGNDTIKGGAGQDKGFGGSGSDELRGGNGNDILKGGNNNDKINGGNGNDLIMGGKGNDRLFGGNGNDVLKGGSGNDILRGGSGNDSHFGDSGNDRFWFDQGRDTFRGGTGHDELFLDGRLKDYKVAFKGGEVHFRDGKDLAIAINIEEVTFDNRAYDMDDLRALF